MNQDYNARDAEFAAAVAAAAFTVYSIEEAEAECRRKKREGVDKSGTKLKSRKQDTRTGLQQSSGRGSRQFSSEELNRINIFTIIYFPFYEAPFTGESSTRNLVEMDHSREQESGFQMRRPSRSSSVAIDRKHKGNEPRDENVETKADAWERAQMEKNIKRYEKIKSGILDWENERKMQAKLKMERKKERTKRLD
ncbi:hypothetical protein Ddye_009324 [Dipteronia dyeriana]|uniref:Remorin C-terminal domain-containing protein n=1 Tax=Dipteronia dyeriana TaxID=168575 RepID=A0AAD9XBJ3_9ROSI|nr:hypothetical protein Ddye_009324 [Dipteronia dyeriana]